VNEVFALICSGGKGLRKRKPVKNAGQSHQAPLSINLSNQFYEDLRQLNDLEPFVKAALYILNCEKKL
jgi:hypothetical protein